jgi:hypothetical protein
LGYVSPLEFEKQLKIKNQRRWDDELNGGGDILMLSKHWSREARS